MFNVYKCIMAAGERA